MSDFFFCLDNHHLSSRKETEGWWLFKEIKILPKVGSYIGQFKVVRVTYLGNGECYVSGEPEKNWTAEVVKRKNKKNLGSPGNNHCGISPLIIHMLCTPFASDGGLSYDAVAVS